jgi:hypothetical protein
MSDGKTLAKRWGGITALVVASGAAGGALKSCIAETAGVVGLQTAEGAKADHKEITDEVSATYQTIAQHDLDQVITDQRVSQMEESDKLRVEQMDDMDDRLWEAVIILRELRKNGR